TGLIHRNLDDTATPPVTVTALLHRDRPAPRSTLTALARMDVTGAPVDWSALYPAPGPRPVTLPGYAFRRQRYWLPPAGASDVATAGLADPDHPLLAAVVTDPESGAATFTGRLSQATQPWLADHT